jgi:hypothetical protein
MPAGPPRICERIIGLFIPPSRREDVLGDLRERYTNRWQYMIEAIRTTPLVIFGAIRRTTDAQLFLMEALLLYVSFLSALWYMNRAMLDDQWGLLRPAIPAAIAIAILALYDAWSPPEKRAPIRHGLRVVIALCGACLCQIAALPREAAVFGAGIAALLVSTVRMLFPPGIALPQKAGGSTQATQDISAPAEPSANARRFRDAGETVFALILLAVVLRYRGMALTIVAAIAVIVFQFKRSWKE